MTINIFVLKRDLNGKIVVVRFFFFVGYITVYSYGFGISVSPNRFHHDVISFINDVNMDEFAHSQ